MDTDQEQKSSSQNPESVKSEETEKDKEVPEETTEVTKPQKNGKPGKLLYLTKVIRRMQLNSFSPAKDHHKYLKNLQYHTIFGEK
jgi:hypothetical protein